MENKMIKKNKKPLVIVAMILMVALVCGMGAMTYSKYISTTDAPAQNATAAQWGFVVTADASKLFGDAYKYDGASISKIEDNYGDAGLSIKANTEGKNIVAPGSTGSMTISVNGQAEVLAKLTIDVEDFSTIKYGTYFPILWTLKDDGAVVTGCERVTDINLIIDKLEGDNGNYKPGTSINKNYELSWEWPFETGNTDDLKAENNINDTVIGLINAYSATDSVADKTTYPTLESYVRAALGKDDYTIAGDYLTSISFDVKITVEQIQE